MPAQRQKVSITVFSKGERTTAPTPGIRKDSFAKYAPQLNGVIADLWNRVTAHEQRGMERVAGKGKDASWRGRLGLGDEPQPQQDAARIRSAYKAARKAREQATKLLIESLDTRASLHPFTGDDGNGAAAVAVRQQIRERMASMSPDAREKLLKQPLDDVTRRALFEAPEWVSGFDADSVTYQRLRDDAMRDLHAGQLERVEALAEASEYVTKLASGLEQCCKAEAAELGIMPHEFTDFVEASPAFPGDPPGPTAPV